MNDICNRFTAQALQEIMRLRAEIEHWKHRALKAETALAEIHKMSNRNKADVS